MAMMAAPVWAANSGSFHAMAKVTAASNLSSDELDAVEGGVVTVGPSVLLPISTNISNFLNLVLQQQYGVGPYPPIVVNTSIQATPSATGGVTFTPVHTIQPLTLVLR
jgi:hypothetical protein